MVNPTGSALFFVVFLVLLSEGVGAAEIQGRMWAAKGTNIPGGIEVVVECGNPPPKSVPLARSGRYSLRHLPANRSCRLTVQIKEKSITSAPLSVHTRKSVVTVNAELRLVRRSLLIFRR